MGMRNKKNAVNIKIETLLGKGSGFQGEFQVEGSARVDGIINGNVKVSNTLIVGSGGKINGMIEAKSAIIGGEIQGNIYVTEKTELTSTGKVIGDIHTKLIVIDENGIFQGKCDMSQNTSDEKKGKAGEFFNKKSEKLETEKKEVQKESEEKEVQKESEEKKVQKESEEKKV